MGLVRMVKGGQGFEPNDKKPNDYTAKGIGVPKTHPLSPAGGTLMCNSTSRKGGDGLWI